MRHPNAYHPWGFGTRACIGSQFAIFEAKSFLALLLVHFKWTGKPGYRLMPALVKGNASPNAKPPISATFPAPMIFEHTTMTHVAASNRSKCLN